MGGKITPRIRLTSAKDLVEVGAELGNSRQVMFDSVQKVCPRGGIVRTHNKCKSPYLNSYFYCGSHC